MTSRGSHVHKAMHTLLSFITGLYFSALVHICACVKCTIWLCKTEHKTKYVYTVVGLGNIAILGYAISVSQIFTFQ